jgi:hypothetical protein
MANMVINRFNIDVTKRDIGLSFFTENNTHYLKHKKPTYLYEDLEKNQTAREIKDWLKDFKREQIEDEQCIYFSFYEAIGAENKVTINNYNDKFIKQFIRETLLKLFLDKGLLVEPYKEGCDFCIYQKAGTENGFEKYIRYDFVIYSYFGLFPLFPNLKLRFEPFCNGLSAFS